jgi:hypothetical protein
LVLDVWRRSIQNSNYIYSYLIQFLIIIVLSFYNIEKYIIFDNSVLSPDDSGKFNDLLKLRFKKIHKIESLINNHNILKVNNQNYKLNIDYLLSHKIYNLFKINFYSYEDPNNLITDCIAVEKEKNHLNLYVYRSDNLKCEKFNYYKNRIGIKLDKVDVLFKVLSLSNMKIKSGKDEVIVF